LSVSTGTPAEVGIVARQTNVEVGSIGYDTGIR
jgi:hypothetical protein